MDKPEKNDDDNDDDEWLKPFLDSFDLTDLFLNE